MAGDKEGFLIPAVNAERCINCGLCLRICPAAAAAPEENAEKKPPLLYAAFHRDIKKRGQSTSGGAFAAIAEAVIAHGGVVFGSGFDRNYDNVVCREAADAGELEGLKKSKYVQGRMGNVYFEIEKHLNSGKLVFFSGTPCQTAGVQAYFQHRTNSERLYTCDLICHGVPSNLAWRRYKDWLSEVLGGSLSDFQFRNKEKGWKNSLRSCAVNGRKVLLRGKKLDSYCQAYYLNLMLRESCYKCPFDCKSHADITLADYWGIEKKGIFSGHDIHYGISRIEVNTARGRDFLAEMGPGLELYPADWDNRCPVKTVRPVQRDNFYQRVNDSWGAVLPLIKIPFKSRVKLMAREYLPEWILNILRNM